jgi:membrane protease YdiL (CAAX protease family)
VHLPDVALALMAVPGGVAWSYYYLRWRRLGPLALSHGVLGTAYFHWIRGEDPLARWLGA